MVCLFNMEFSYFSLENDPPSSLPVDSYTLEDGIIVVVIIIDMGGVLVMVLVVLVVVLVVLGVVF